MKKMIIALILILPLLFMFTVFSAVKTAGLNVDISANGIEIQNDLENDTLYLDLATYKNDYVVNAVVTPINAKNRQFTYSVESMAGSEFANVSIDENGKISAYSLGNAKIVVKSNDGGYTDSIDVVVNSSKTVGIEPSLFAITDSEMQNNLLSKTQDGFEADIVTGTYSYQAWAYPVSDEIVQIESLKGNAVIDIMSKTIMFPFEGEYEVKFSVNDGIDGNTVAIAKFDVTSLKNQSGILVNGEDNPTIEVDDINLSAKVYLSLPTNDYPTLQGTGKTFVKAHSLVKLADGQYEFEFILSDNAPDVITLEIAVGEKVQSINIVRGEFSFSIKTSLPVQSGNDISVLANSQIELYAVGSSVADNITYKWEIIGQHNGAVVEYASDGRICNLISGGANSQFKIECAVYRNNVPLDLPSQIINVKVVNKASSVVFNDPKPKGLAQSVAIAKYKYNDSLTKVLNEYYFDINPVDISGGQVNLSDFDIEVSNPDIADITIVNGKAKLNIKNTGLVTIALHWSGNKSYGADISAEYTFEAVKDGVLVTNSDEIFKATQAGNAVVVGSDIMLGTNSNGEVYSIEQRIAMLGTMQSTYNIKYQESQNKSTIVNYVLEFKNNVYGNGYTLNAQNFTKAEDSTGKPLIFKGALPLLGAYADQNQIMKISAQDNIAFLVRTDGVVISNVTLLGCSDEQLLDDDVYDLNNLNNVGTVLDINADASILNCRIRNGKTNVRIYGGNRDGNAFFVQGVSGVDISDSDRIIVQINGCIISQAREFLVKTGANRVVKSYGQNSEPDLLRQNSQPYSPFEDLLNDQYFYDKYVLTDVTIENSVFEKSGLFALGMESNFSGGVLNEDILNDYGFEFTNGWGVGGTMFGSVIRLKGDVRFYDWKILDNIDSSSLVEIQEESIFAQFQLNVAEMIECVVENSDDSFKDIFTTGADSKTYVNSSIIKYGGGKNYAQLDLSGLDAQYKDFGKYNINVSILKKSDDPSLQKQGEYFPIAAGTQDFVFYMYSSKSANSLQKQLDDYANGTAYSGIVSVIK